MKVKLFTFIIILILMAEFSYMGAESNTLRTADEVQSVEVLTPFLNESSFPRVNNLLADSSHIFTENCGQLENDEVRFYDQGGNVWFTDEGMWIEVRESTESRVQGRESYELSDQRDRFSEPEPVEYKRVVLKQEFIEANNVMAEGREKFDYYNNYFYGNDSSNWFTNVPNYQEIYYENIYDGIDLRYYPNQNGLKYDLIVHPGADVQQIRVKYEGANGLEINKYGDLLIKTSIGNIVDNDLCIYQEHNGKGERNYINGKFVTYDNLEYSFEILDDYNKHEILVIDPHIELEYSTYLGGTNNDRGESITADLFGNAYITGRTKSSNFPTSTGAHNESYNNRNDVFVTKLNPTGSTLGYSTFIGGDDDDIGFSIAVDSSGNTFVTGETESSDFPVTNGAYDTAKGSTYSDIFVLKLTADGSTLSFSTFIGGHSSECAYGIAVDLNGYSYIVGETYSSSFPITPGAYDDSYNQNRDCFVLKLNQTGSNLTYSTYLGGDSWDSGYDIEIDTTCNAYVTGITSSDDFPTSINAFSRTPASNQFELFVSKLNNLGSDIIYSTYVGGTGTDWGYGIEIDSQGYTYVAGRTRSSDFPITNGVYDDSYGGGSSYGDGYIFKLNKTGSKLIFSTYIGNSSDDDLYDIALDTVGNIYITGDTKSSNFPVTSDANQSTSNSWRDGFISKLSGDGANLIYSSFLGGDDDDYCKGIALDPSGNIYVTGYTESSDFPNTPGAYNQTHSGLEDAFITKFSFEPYISIPSVLLLHNETPTTIAYSQLSPYTFKVNVIDSVSKTDLQDVYLTLDPLGTNIQLRWNRSSGQFTKLGDPNNYILIDPSSKVDNLINYWSIYFNVIFNWSYPNEKLHNVQAFASSMTLSPSWFNITEMYRVENDLVFNGTLKITDENKHIISDNDLVRGGQLLNWSGLTIVYENTTDVFPPDSICNISLWDEIGNSWLIPAAEGEVFNIEIFAPTSTYLTDFNYTINISGVPLECDATNETFTIRVDGNNVTFSDPSPNNATWQTSNKVIVSVNITDSGGGQVNHSTIQQSISTMNGTIWSDWKEITGLNSDTTIIVQDVITLDEGINNLVKWKAADSVDNGPIESDTYRILVDTQEITYSNAWPTSSESSNTTALEVGITLSDVTSGVDVSTIEFRVSKDRGNTWTPWMEIEGFENGSKIEVRVNYTFNNGTNNRIKWRAFDIAGNGPTESQWYTVDVDTWTSIKKPSVTLFSPPNAMVINVSQLELHWKLDDDITDGILYDIYLGNVTPPAILRSNISDTSLIIDGLIDGETYYWCVIPKYGEIEGTCSNGLWWFKIDLKKDDQVYKIQLGGIESISIYPGENKSIVLTITNLGTSEDMISLSLQANKLSNYISINDNSPITITSKDYATRNLEIKLPKTAEPGLYEIIVNAISLYDEEKDSHIISVEILDPDKNGNNNGPPDGADPNGTEPNGTKESPVRSNDLLMYSIVGIIIIMIIVLSVLFLVLKKKKREAEKISTKTSFTTKPLPAQVVNIVDPPQVAQAILQPPAQTIMPSATLQQSQAVTTLSLPTVAQQPSAFQQPSESPMEIPTQVPVPSIVQVAQTPQLPPAQISSTSTTDESSQIMQDTSTTIEATPTPTIETGPMELPQPSSSSTVTPAISQLTTSQTPQTTKTETSQPIPTVTTPNQSKMAEESMPSTSATTTSATPIPVSPITPISEPQIAQETPQMTDQKLSKQQQIPKPQDNIQQAPRNQPVQQNLCLTCGQVLTYYSQNNKYYCPSCQKYT